MRSRLLVPALAVGLALPLFAASGAAADGGGFHTIKPAMLAGVGGTSVHPIISVGDVVDGYVFESIPDGISVVRANGRGTVDIMLNHETSRVPFPATRQDATNALLSRIRLTRNGAGVASGSYTIADTAGYQRFCSNFLAGSAEGFERPTLFTTEEARDIVRRQGDSWAPGLAVGPGAPAINEQAGVVVAVDPATGAYRSIYGMGRHNHENAVALGGYGHPVVLSGDDTFDAPASQLYLYSAATGADVWADRGALYAFVSDDAAINDYGDLVAGASVTGHYIEVPRDIAVGKLGGEPRARELVAADKGYAAPPAGIPDGPQWVLESWSNANNVFQFIRIEDLAVDRTNPRVLYFADTGEPRAVADAATTRLRRAPSGTRGLYPNGRVFKMTFGSDPLVGARLEVLADFDAGGYGNATEVHNPDNVETTPTAIYVTEDPGSHNAFNATRFPDATNARVWRIDLATGARQVVAEIDQSVNAAQATAKGAWETAGIVDVSAHYGPGAFLINVQAHGWDTKVADNPQPGFPALASYRENGQLLLIRVANP